MYFVASYITQLISQWLCVLFFNEKPTVTNIFTQKITRFLITPLCYKITMNNLINKWT